MKKKNILVIMAAVLLIAAFSAGQSKEADMTEKIEDYFSGEYVKESMTEVANMLTYCDGRGNSIFFYALKTTYYGTSPNRADSALNTSAFEAILGTAAKGEYMQTSVYDYSGGFYESGERAWLCWTASPEYSYILEYDPKSVSREDILKMAKSAHG